MYGQNEGYNGLNVSQSLFVRGIDILELYKRALKVPQATKQPNLIKIG